MADVLLNRPADSSGHDILLNTSRELLIVSDSAGMPIIAGFEDSSLLLLPVASGGVPQADLDSANSLITTLRASLDSAESAAGGSGGGNTQRWIA